MRIRYSRYSERTKLSAEQVQGCENDTHSKLNRNATDRDESALYGGE